MLERVELPVSPQVAFVFGKTIQPVYYKRLPQCLYLYNHTCVPGRLVRLSRSKMRCDSGVNLSGSLARLQINMA
jgi:hypothetical protein